MKTLKLLAAVGGIDPEHIASASGIEMRRGASMRMLKNQTMKTLIPIAAGLCLLIGGVTAIAVLNSKPGKTPDQTVQLPNVEQMEVDDPLHTGITQGEVQHFEDAAVDENSYSEARVYAKEIQDLQDRITAAMSNHELPFVTSSMILENPDRIHVYVKTTDEELLGQLKAYNTEEVILEIEYSTGENSEERAVTE